MDNKEGLMKPSESPDLISIIGRVALLMCKSDDYCQFPIACLAIWIKPAALLRQIHFFKDVSGSDVGYMTWAAVRPDTDARLRSDPEVILHVSEWNEGEIFWVMDFVSVNGRVREKLAEAELIIPSLRVAYSARRDDEGRVKRVSKWFRRTRT
ncbi:toxin-activating lysine-acyltransferase [Luteimonas flava]|uniref:toxin-activating lysine-acyltransferase n=1 Tax=Luteimonas flava TaxID=3115822 RepID=UPI003CCDEF4E